MSLVTRSLALTPFLEREELAALALTAPAAAPGRGRVGDERARVVAGEV